jgi:hypothetical protein
LETRGWNLTKCAFAHSIRGIRAAREVHHGRDDAGDPRRCFARNPRRRIS